MNQEERIALLERQVHTLIDAVESLINNGLARGWTLEGAQPALLMVHEARGMN